MNDEQDELLLEFEKMLEEIDDEEEYDPSEDFTLFDLESLPYWPNEEELEYPEESDSPPPVPKKVICKHKNKREASVSDFDLFWYCPDCKEDVGKIKKG